MECLNYFKAKFPDYAKSHACETLDRDIKAAIFSRTENGMLQKSPYPCEISIALNARMAVIKQLYKILNTLLLKPTKVSYSADGDEKPDDRTGSGMKPGSQISDQEKYWRSEANDYEARFCGHCNTTTDIKEANFFGRYVSFLELKCQLSYMTWFYG